MGEVVRERVVLGGFAQQVVVRGRDTGNPLLLVLHGGPGFAEMPLFATYNADLEDDFLVAYWDQRGAGRSFRPDEIPGGSMTLRRIVADAGELAGWLTARFGQDKVYLVGHSWGSLVGATLASERPELVHAFVGVGQLVDGMRNERDSYAFTLREALAAVDTEAVEALRGIEDHYSGPDRMSFADFVVQRPLLERYGGVVHSTTLPALFDKVEPELRDEYFGELAGAAQEFSFGFLLPDFLGANLAVTARAFDVPVHFAVGRYDQNTPAGITAEYFDGITAPAKGLHWFEESAHMIPFEEPAAFHALLRDVAAR